MEFQDVLRQHSLFSALSDNEIRELRQLSQPRKVNAGAVVFLKDDPGDGLYGILSGEIDITAASSVGKEVVLTSLRAGDVFGEIATLDGRGRTATASARMDSVLFFVSRSNFMRFAGCRPELLMRMIALLCDRLRRTTESLEDSIFLDVAGRLSKRLLAVALVEHSSNGNANGGVVLRVTQAGLAREIGATREIVSRQLQVWKLRGLIQIGRNTLTVASFEKLRQQVEFLDRN